MCTRLVWTLLLFTFFFVLCTPTYDDDGLIRKREKLEKTHTHSKGIPWETLFLTCVCANVKLLEDIEHNVALNHLSQDSVKVRYPTYIFPFLNIMSERMYAYICVWTEKDCFPPPSLFNFFTAWTDLFRFLFLFFLAFAWKESLIGFLLKKKKKTIWLLLEAASTW